MTEVIFNSQNPAPGIYAIDIKDYHASAGVSRSGLMLFKKTPMHYWDAYLNPEKEEKKKSDALIFGNAVHSFILEPEEFFKRYVVAPKVDRRTSAGKAQYAEFILQSEFGEILLQDDFDKIEKIKSSVMSNDDARKIIEGAEIEKSFYWVNKETGVLCKCRPDILRAKLIADLKTTENAEENSFKHSVQNYGYHIQAAMIQEGVQACTGRLIENFWFILVEKSRPYASAVYMLDQESINKGKIDFLELLLRYKKSTEENSYPTYPVKTISLPAYALTLGV
jgi:hypothetical protein